MKKKIITIITAYVIFLNLVWSSQMIVGLSLPCVQKCFAGPAMVEQLISAGIIPANSKIYYDYKTKYKYMENQDGTFSEYNQKGKLLKKTQRKPKDLKRHPYILAISNDTLLLYTKSNQQDNSNSIVQNANKPHPFGWFLKKALLPIE